jgi:NAD/NADP transhydrogenase beta subunit
LGESLIDGLCFVFLTQQIFCVLCGAGQLLAFSTAMNAVTLHGACTIAWVVICTALGIAIGMIRTLDKISWTNWVALVSLMGALITAAAACAVQTQPALAPVGEPLFLDVRLFHNPGFLPGVQAGTNIILAFTGGPAFYNVLAEMKNPKDFNKSVYFAQSWVTTTYLVISCVIYASVGQYIDSPALGSAGPLMKRVCYGIVLPGLIIGAVLYIHIPAKYGTSMTR